MFYEERVQIIMCLLQQQHLLSRAQLCSGTPLLIVQLYHQHLLQFSIIYSLVNLFSVKFDIFVPYVNIRASNRLQCSVISTDYEFNCCCYFAFVYDSLYFSAIWMQLYRPCSIG